VESGNGNVSISLMGSNVNLIMSHHYPSPATPGHLQIFKLGIESIEQKIRPSLHAVKLKTL
jgi:hypothetical protein